MLSLDAFSRAQMRLAAKEGGVAEEEKRERRVRVGGIASFLFNFSLQAWMMCWLAEMTEVDAV